jgi:hypothetical protein
LSNLLCTKINWLTGTKNFPGNTIPSSYNRHTLCAVKAVSARYQQNELLQKTREVKIFRKGKNFYLARYQIGTWKGEIFFVFACMGQI